MPETPGRKKQGFRVRIASRHCVGGTPAAQWSGRETVTLSDCPRATKTWQVVEGRWNMGNSVRNVYPPCAIYHLPPTQICR